MCQYNNTHKKILPSNLPILYKLIDSNSSHELLRFPMITKPSRTTRLPKVSKNITSFKRYKLPQITVQ